jgi:hypothetical protein
MIYPSMWVKPADWKKNHGLKNIFKNGETQAEMETRKKMFVSLGAFCSEEVSVFVFWEANAAKKEINMNKVVHKMLMVPYKKSA